MRMRHESNFEGNYEIKNLRLAMNIHLIDLEKQDIRFVVCLWWKKLCKQVIIRNVKINLKRLSIILNRAFLEKWESFATNIINNQSFNWGLL